MEIDENEAEEATEDDHNVGISCGLSDDIDTFDDDTTDSASSSIPHDENDNEEDDGSIMRGSSLFVRLCDNDDEASDHFNDSDNDDADDDADDAADDDDELATIFPAPGATEPARLEDMMISTEGCDSIPSPSIASITSFERTSFEYKSHNNHINNTIDGNNNNNHKII